MMIDRQIRELEGKKERDMNEKELLLLRDWYFHRRDQVMSGSISYERLTAQIGVITRELECRKYGTSPIQKDRGASEGCGSV